MTCARRALVPMPDSPARGGGAPRALLALCLLAGAVFASGCQVIRFIPNEYTMIPTSTDWPDQHRRVAMRSYLYAQMSSNTYGQMGATYRCAERDFVLPKSYSSRHFPNQPHTGLAYSIYENESESEPEVVLAFRGTEGPGDDADMRANLFEKQNAPAIETYRALRRTMDEAGRAEVPIVLTGHSLGGALAIHIAINVDDDLSYFVFNTSPRFSKKGARQAMGPERHSIVESNDFLRWARRLAREADQRYTPFNCTALVGEGGAHGIERLARCLTKIAALNIDGIDEVEMVRKNPPELCAGH